MILHDMHLQFRSPTVNLFFENEQFIIFCEHLEYYCSLPVLEVTGTGKNYPVGVLSGQYGDVFLYFMHYHSFEEARVKWEERTKRIDYSNLYVIMESLPGCPESLLERFDKLPYKKVVLTEGLHIKIKNSFPIDESFYAQDYWKGKIMEYPPKGIRRYYESFDYAHFFNSGKIRGRII